MVCAICQQELPDQARFCPNCGAPAFPEGVRTQPVDTTGDDVLEGLDETATGLDDPLFASQALDDVKLWSASGGETLSYASLELPSASPEQLPAQSALAPQGKTFGSRAGAYFIDAFVYNLISLGGGFALIFLLSAVLVAIGTPLLPAATQPDFTWENLLFSLALGVLYFALYEWLYGATPGKLILKMRVVREDGRQPTLGAALLRGVFRYIDGLIFGLPAAVAMNRDARRQRLGDRYAHTLVVGARDPIIQGHRSGMWFILATALACILLPLSTALLALQYMKVAEPLTAVAASDLNLQVDDLGQDFTLEVDVGKEAFEGFPGDASVRLFVGDAVNLQAQVMTFPFYPTDTMEELSVEFQQATAMEDPALQLVFAPIHEIPVGERAGVAEFTRPETGETGYVLFSIRRNVVTRLFTYGMPGAMPEADLVRLARIVDSRIR